MLKPAKKPTLMNKDVDLLMGHIIGNDDPSNVTTKIVPVISFEEGSYFLSLHSEKKVFYFQATAPMTPIGWDRTFPIFKGLTSTLSADTVMELLSNLLDITWPSMVNKVVDNEDVLVEGEASWMLIHVDSAADEPYDVTPGSETNHIDESQSGINALLERRKEMIRTSYAAMSATDASTRALGRINSGTSDEVDDLLAVMAPPITFLNSRFGDTFVADMFTHVVVSEPDVTALQLFADVVLAAYVLASGNRAYSDSALQVLDVMMVKRFHSLIEFAKERRAVSNINFGELDWNAKISNAINLSLAAYNRDFPFDLEPSSPAVDESIPSDNQTPPAEERFPVGDSIDPDMD